MWKWIVVLFCDIIIKTHGYSDGIFPESCLSMSPLHKRDGKPFLAQRGEPPFFIEHHHNRTDNSIKVVLKTKEDKTFEGFMLEARMPNGSIADGKFIILEPDQTRLLTCFEIKDSAVSQRNNQPKTSIEVNWIPGGEMPPLIEFRGTFVQDFAVFWENVNITITTDTMISTTIPPMDTSILLMAGVGVGVSVKLGSSNVFTVRVAGNLGWRYLNKVIKILTPLFFIALDICALVLCEHCNLALVALMYTVMVINCFELVMACLPIGPSHELKEICDLSEKVCCFIHKFFIVAIIFLGVWQIDTCSDYILGSWLLKVLITLTVWIFLRAVIVFVLHLHKNAILGEWETGNKDEQQIQKSRRTIIVAVSLFLDTVTAALIAAVIAGIIMCQS